MIGGNDAVYSGAEVAVLMGFSPQTVTRLFEKEVGVLIIERPHVRGKRSYRSIRIPRRLRPSGPVEYLPVRRGTIA